MLAKSKHSYRCYRTYAAVLEEELNTVDEIGISVERVSFINKYSSNYLALT